MGDALIWHRLQFSFTIIYHYLFPQLTMGLALYIVLLKGWALYKKSEPHNDLARFWIRIFGVTFAVGVVTGLPMEFQFGTNWARFSKYAGAVIGQTLGMEGLFAFFLESSLLSLLVFGEKRLGQRRHFIVAVFLFIGSWASGYFIIVANAFMQYPVGHALVEGRLVLRDFWAFVFNAWSLIEFAHNQMAAVVTSAFVVAAVGAYWSLRGEHEAAAALNLRWGTRVGLVASLLVAFPTGDQQAKLVAKHQPTALAAMEGRFESGSAASLSLIGQPNVPERKLDNPIRIPGILSFLAFGTFHSDVRGLNEFSPTDWPTNIELLYYSFHVMAGLGTMFIALMGLGVLLDLRRNFPPSTSTLGRKEGRGGGRKKSLPRPLLWIFLFAFPFPYIANTAGWMTAELGRQPWLIFGLMRTADGTSPTVHSGDALFTLIGFFGLFFVLGLLYLFLVLRDVAHGPEGSHE